jgi:hypothetical protein
VPGGRHTAFRDEETTEQWVNYFKSVTCLIDDNADIVHFQDVFLWKYFVMLLPDANHHTFIRHSFTRMLSKEKEYVENNPEFQHLFFQEREKFIHLVAVEEEYLSKSKSLITASPSHAQYLIEQKVPSEKIKIVQSYSDKLPAIYNEYTSLTALLPVSTEASDFMFFFFGRKDLQKGYTRLLQSKIQIEYNTQFSLYHDKSKHKKFYEIEYNNTAGYGIRFAVFPAIYETRGMVLQESMASGMIPIVQKGVSGLEEQIEHMHTGIVLDFENDNWNDIVTSIPPHVLKTIASNAVQDIMAKSSKNDFVTLLAKQIQIIGNTPLRKHNPEVAFIDCDSVV